MGRPMANLTLTDDEQSELRGWARRPTTAQAHALRARIILACAEGASNGDVADDLSVTRQTVGKWRSRFLEKRLDGLVDAPRPGTPRTVTDEDVEQVIATALEQTPSARAVRHPPAKRHKNYCAKHRGIRQLRVALAAKGLDTPYATVPLP